MVWARSRDAALSTWLAARQPESSTPGCPRGRTGVAQPRGARIDEGGIPISRWWTQLGLGVVVRSPLGPPPKSRALVLARLVPAGFDSPDGQITFEEAVQRLDAAQAEVERSREFEEAA